MLNYHLAAFIAGFILDMILGDPYFLPHPIRLIGWLITKWEHVLYGQKHPTVNGGFLVFAVIFLTVTGSGFVLAFAYVLHPISGILVESIMTYQILALKCLRVESMKVYDSLKDGNLDNAREAVSMIVGRDTQNLDEEDIVKATVETVSENTSDGVIAPMIYLAVGGPVLGFVYKAINTMDSMIGYKNERYLYFGRIAAKLDDIVNYIPSRVSAWLMILSAFLLGKQYNGKRAYQIFKRDRRNHASPNSAQTESVMAGALSVRLAGDAYYFGKLVKKKYIGDDIRKIETMDIKRANRIMYLTAGICEVMCILFLYAFGNIVF